jgi:hypothetical protein
MRGWMGLLVLAPAVAAADPGWTFRLTGGAQWNPEAPNAGASRFAGGTGVRVLGSVSSACAIGAQVEAWWHVSLADTFQTDGNEQDFLLVGRCGVDIDVFRLSFEIGLGLARYSANYFRPGSCRTCGNESGSTGAPIVYPGVALGWKMWRGLSLEAGVRLALARPAKTETTPEFIPASFALRFDLGVEYAF